MPTKAELEMEVREASELADAIADILTDPSLDHAEARAMALDALDFEVPEFVEVDAE